MDNSVDKAILNTSMNGLRSLLVLFLSAGFLGIGMLKLIAMPDMVNYFNAWELPLWTMYAIGGIELLLSVAIFYVPSRKMASLAFIALMFGATALHLLHKEYNYLIGPAIIITSAAILYLIEQKLNK